MLKYADFLRITDFENGNRYLNSFLGQQMKNTWVSCIFIQVFESFY